MSDADIDEFFDFPGSDVMELREFLDYLNRNQFTAVMTQLLDMFSDQPLSHLVQKQQEDLKDVYSTLTFRTGKNRISPS